MSIKVWPFLVSRNRMLDYRTVVAPDFICNAGIAKLLARVAEGNLTERGCAIRRRIEGSDAGDFTIVFRVVYAREKHINPNGGNEVLKDSFGREIDLLEGVVFKEVGEIDVKEVELEKAHKLLTKSFKNFWGWKEPHSAIPSEAFSLELNTPSSSLKIEDLSPLKVNVPKVIRESIPRPKPTNCPLKPGFIPVKILFFTTVALILGFWLFTLLGNTGEKFGENPKGNTGTVIVYTTLEKKIEFKNQKSQVSLTDLLGKFPNSAIFLSGSLKVRESKDIKLPARSKEKQTITLSENKLEMKYQPFNQAIAKLLEENVSDGTVTATIIQPDPNGIPPRLCFDWS
ncbi:hypothetical protein [Floridanema evergladense]|uniref:Uncharacterized protein n=1 Tax=Floridaenema evergladense BLCC-F167 TaxID=3153639 RepID=A0ABV4WN59_9CYAN